MGRRKKRQRPVAPTLLDDIQSAKEVDQEDNNDNNGNGVDIGLWSNEKTHIDLDGNAYFMTNKYINRNCYSTLNSIDLEEREKNPTNWLNEIYTLTKSDTTSTTITQSNASITSNVRRQEQQQNASSNNNLFAAEVYHLTGKLNSIKHQLWPAAIQKSKMKNIESRRRRKKQNQNRDNDQNVTTTTSPSIEFRCARDQCNPFEELSTMEWIESKKGFVCRSAMKLANIDAMIGFQLTPPMGNNNESSRHSNFRFVDLCGAPGGFSEYLLRRCSSNGKCCMGYGMSLIGSNDDGQGAKWDLNTLSYLAKKSQQNINWNVCNGDDNTGDIYNWNNVIKLTDDIKQDSSSEHDNDEWKVDLVVADGGFDAQRDSECQESLAHQLVTCQTAAALHLLQKGGNFVIKMFGFQSSKELVIQLYNSFEKLIILKPITSRPASAERYLVALNFDGLDSSFDIISWRDEIVYSDREPFHINDKLSNYLDQIDCDMLHLNIQTCSSIIDCLDKFDLSKNTLDDRSNDGDMDFSFYQKEFDINF